MLHSASQIHIQRISNVEKNARAGARSTGHFWPTFFGMHDVSSCTLQPACIYILQMLCLMLTGWSLFICIMVKSKDKKRFSSATLDRSLLYKIVCYFTDKSYAYVAKLKISKYIHHKKHVIKNSGHNLQKCWDKTQKLLFSFN